MTYCVGLTGNIASGKTLVSQLFAQQGVNTYSADAVAKALSSKGQYAYKAIVKHFGPEVLLDNNELNRPFIREIIFSNQKEKKWLESLLHPLIREQLKQLVTQSTSAYCLVEIPLLTNKKTYPYLNRILLVYAPEDIQISRLMQRDACSRQQAEAILYSQPSNTSRLKIADEVLYNDSNLTTLSNGVTVLHQNYLNEALSPH